MGLELLIPNRVIESKDHSFQEIILSIPVVIKSFDTMVSMETQLIS